MCERYKNMNDDFDIVSIMGGVNDYLRVAPVETINDNTSNTFYGTLNIICDGLKKKYPHSFIFFMIPLDTAIKPYSSNVSSSLGDFRKAIKDVCNKYDIDVLDTAIKADYKKEYNSNNYKGDGLHPSSNIHKNVLGPVIAKYIIDNYRFA